MQNKGAIKLFSILLALVCVYQLMFTFKAKKVEKDATDFGNGNATMEQFYLDSMSGEVAYNFLWMKEYTYKEVKEQEINLGLDLKGGMNVTLEVSVSDIIKALSNYSDDATFQQAIKNAQEAEKDGDSDFIDNFVSEFESLDGDASLAAIFDTPELSEKINFSTSNEDVKKVLSEETENAIANSFNIIRSRIDRFGVAQPNIQRLQKRGRILVELPGINDPARVRKLLQGTAKLEFWETYENSEVLNYLMQINQRLVEQNKLAESTTEVSNSEAEADTTSLLGQLNSSADSLAQQQAMSKQFPLFTEYNLSPRQGPNGQPYPGPVIAMAHKKDTAKINTLFSSNIGKELLPRQLKLCWGAKPIDAAGNVYELYALKDRRGNGQAPLDGGVITDAKQDYDNGGKNIVVDMSMNREGAKTWANLTRDNIGKCVAITLDDYVQSAPTVNVEITGGRSQISGHFTTQEGQDLANMLKSGKLPAPAHIIQEEMVGPTLGKESIESGLFSFIIAFVLILIYMLFFYSKHAGTVANIALLVNLFFIIGILASLGAVLTLPGIAGIVLTIGMSVDANVLIYERIQEELLSGKGVKLAVSDGYKNALSAIIDGQVTTLLTGIVLATFGSGPIQGFATTLIIGIVTSFLSAVFISRIIFEAWLSKNPNLTFASKSTMSWLRSTSIKFLQKRKTAYIISGVCIVISLFSLTFKGLNYSIDFKGGRTYVVRFDENVQVADISKSLAAEFGNAPEVKTFGGDNQVRITTSYKIDEDGTNIDQEIEEKLYAGCKEYLGADVTLDTFLSDYRISSQKVGPTISDDIKKDAAISILLSLVIIFLYILIRFNNWQYGLGAIAALAHDSILVLGIFSLGNGILPFSLDVDQAFIAAILTVLGYSINDTVVVFDRIREYIGLHPKQDREQVIDSALNSTLRRTFSTSLSTFVVLLAIFLFGGTSIQGFTFALLTGVVVGTYSSLFIATPVAFDTTKRVAKVVSKRSK